MSGGRGTVKCLVWDLDDTLWDGVVLENDRPEPEPVAVRTLRTLDERGLLHAVASRGEYVAAAGHLAECGLDELFSAVEVGWGPKSAAVRRIAETLQIGLDTLAFVDNDPVERAEVESALPMVRCYPAAELAGLPGRAEFQPGPVTSEGRARRRLYREERQRQAAEDEWGPDRNGFLRSLDLEMTVRPAREDDLARAVELTVRTNQLNSTGVLFDADELRRLCASPAHQVVVAELRDRFGDYGVIGLAVSELTAHDSVLRLLLMSCRVAARGAGTVLLDQLTAAAARAGRRPLAHFRPTEVNRNMLVTLRFAGYVPLDERDGLMVLAAPADRPARPSHVRILTGRE